jgi:hypothetical protein
MLRQFRLCPGFSDNVQFVSSYRYTKPSLFLAYNYISITSDIDIKIHIQSMLISLQIKEIVNRPVFEKSG